MEVPQAIIEEDVPLKRKRRKRCWSLLSRSTTFRGSTRQSGHQDIQVWNQSQMSYSRNSELLDAFQRPLLTFHFASRYLEGRLELKCHHAAALLLRSARVSTHRVASVARLGLGVVHLRSGKQRSANFTRSALSQPLISRPVTPFFLLLPCRAARPALGLVCPEELLKKEKN